MVKMAAAQQAQQAEHGAECAMCLDEILPVDSVTLSCRHQYHKACVAQLRAHGTTDTCPVCRAKLPPGAERYRNEASLLLVRGERMDPSMAMFFNQNPMHGGSETGFNQEGAEQLYAQAKTLLQQALAEEPHHAPSLVNLAALLERENDFAGSLDTLEKAVAADPNSAHAHCNLGLSRMKSNDASGAQQSFKRAIQLDHNDMLGENRQLYCHLGAAFNMDGDLKSSIVAFKCALKCDENHEYALHGLQHQQRTQHFANMRIDNDGPAYAAALRADKGKLHAEQRAHQAYIDASTKAMQDNGRHLACGSRITVHGLQSTSALQYNGRTGTVLSSVTAGRVTVELDANGDIAATSLKVRPCNLELVHHWEQQGKSRAERTKNLQPPNTGQHLPGLEGIAWKAADHLVSELSSAAVARAADPTQEE
jgi:Flp pilus assembly protein TadD